MSLTFDSDKFHLGKLCPLKHDWNNTGKSLKRKPSYCCIECEKIGHKKYREKNRDKCLAKLKAYRATENNKIAQQKYWSKHENLEKRRLYNEQYRLTEKGKDKRNSGQKRYAATEQGKAVHKKAMRKFLESDKGKAMTREMVKRRRAVKNKVHTVIFTEDQRKSRIEEFDNCCAYCGLKSKMYVDHFIPINKGGSHVLGNLIPACKSCNSSKFDHAPDVWYKSQSFFCLHRWRKILKVLGKTEATINQLPLF